MPSLYSLFQRLETEGTPPDSPRGKRICWIPKAKTSQERKLQTICLSSTDAEVLKRALANHNDAQSEVRTTDQRDSSSQARKLTLHSKTK